MKVLKQILVLVILSSFIVLPCSAASYSLYGSLGSNDTIVNNLVGLYLNQIDYDPYQEYYVARVGQYDYMLFYSDKLFDGDYSYIRYHLLNPGSYNSYYVYEFGEGSNLSISAGSYVGVGNVSDTILSERVSSFKFQYVILVLSFLFIVVFLFKSFSKHFKTRSSKGWDI